MVIIMENGLMKIVKQTQSQPNGIARLKAENAWVSLEKNNKSTSSDI